MTTAAGLGNTTWLPVPAWDMCCGETTVVFGSRQNATISGGDSRSSLGQTQLCHVPVGGLLAGAGQAGTYTAA